MKTLFVAGLALAAVAAAGSAEAAILYEFASDNGTFAYTAPDFIVSQSIAASDLDSCAPLPACLSVSFSQWSDKDRIILVLKYGDNFFVTPSYYFADNAFATAGVHQSGDPGPSGTLTVTPVNAPVPEPGTWALMILGFGTVGVALRTRRQPSVT